MNFFLVFPFLLKYLSLRPWVQYFVEGGAAQVSILSEFSDKRLKAVQLATDQSFIGVNSVWMFGDPWCREELMQVVHQQKFRR